MWTNKTMREHVMDGSLKEREKNYMMLVIEDIAKQGRAKETNHIHTRCRMSNKCTTESTKNKLKQLISIA